MSTAAQRKANRENAQHSTGPTSEAGKQASSRNHVHHGLTGHMFVLLEWEAKEEFEEIVEALCNEHQPATPTEHILVEKMAQHYWLAQRAQSMQTVEMKDNPFTEDVQKRIAPYVRYQAHYERLFQRALHDLLKLRAGRRKEQIGFDSQRRREAQAATSQAWETRRESDENRKLERHKVDMDIRKTRLDREKSNATIRAIAAAAKLEGAVGPQLEKIAA